MLRDVTSLFVVSLLTATVVGCGGGSKAGDTSGPSQGSSDAAASPARFASAPDFDIRGVVASTLAQPSDPLSDSQRRLLDELAAAAEGELFSQFSARTSSVSRLTRRGPPLTKPASGAADETARSFLSHYAELFGISGSDVKRGYFSRDFKTGANGVRHFTLQLQASEVDVFGSLLTLSVSADGSIINASGEPIADAAAHVNISAPVVSEAAAVRAAADAAMVKHVRDSRVLRQVYFPISKNELRLAILVEFQDADSPNLYQSLIDAADGRVLWRKLLTNYDHIPTHGQVYASDSPIPNTPQGSSVGTVARQDLSFTGVVDFPHDEVHTDWWAGAGRTTTTSNNVDAYADRDGDNAADASSRPSAGAGESFTFAIDLTQAPDTYQAAAVANLFYWNNRLHDFFYKLGFDEAAGNFQNDNLSLGGSGGDRVLAEAQDNSDGDPRSLCNANMSTPGDGSSPRMQMYQCDRGVPERDGDLDNAVIGHEYTHGVHTRLLNTSGSQAENEGWADYFGLSVFAEASDPYLGKYGIGDYLFSKNGQGIRSFPFSTDASVFALSYADLNAGSGCAVLTCSSDNTETCTKDEDCSTAGDNCNGRACSFQADCEPPNTAISQGPCVTETHFAGSIWANPLLRARFNLVGKHGYPAGHDAMNLLVIDGMKLTDDNPTFLDARNGILAADQVDFDGAHRCLIWDAFAKSGMGVGAATTGVGDINPIEGYDVPAACSPVLSVSPETSFGNVCVGSSETRTLALYNTGGGDLIVTGLARVSGSPSITLEPLPKLPTFIGADSHVDFRLRCAPTVAGSATATFRITSNDAQGPTTDVVFKCDSGLPDINLAVAGSGDFGEVCAGGHADLPLTLFNQGSCDLRIQSLAMLGSASFVLPADLDLPLLLSHDADFSLPLRYAPNACAVNESATLRLTTNDNDEIVVNVPVRGTSPCGDINVAVADSGDFGDVCAGDHSDLNLTLFNQGRCDVSILGIAVVGGSGSFKLPSDLGLPLVLSHDADFNLPVRFAPEVCNDTPENAIVRLTTSDPDEPTVDIDVTGLAPCGQLVIDPAAVNAAVAFPTTVTDPNGLLGCYSERSVSLRNKGACPLTISAIAASGLVNGSDFVVTTPTQFPIVLPTGEETLGVVVRFVPRADAAPLAPTEVLGELAVTSDDPDGLQVADLCGESATGPGVRVLVSDASSGTAVPLAKVERVDITSKGLNQPSPINLTFNNAALQSMTVCGRLVKYHVEQETLPAVESNGANPGSSYAAAAKQGSLQTEQLFALNQCDFREVQLELKSSSSPACVLLATGASCTTDGQCCSGKCQGNGAKKCN